MPDDRTLPLRELLAIPLADLVHAERAIAEASLLFIKEFGFDGRSAADNFGALRLVTFSYTVIGDGAGDSTREARVPLLSLVPIPLFQVEKAQFEFTVKVESFTRKAKGDSADITGSIASLDVPQQEPRIRVRVELAQSDLPTGITFMIRLMDRASLNDTKAR